jgi:phage shock protein E
MDMTAALTVSAVAMATFIIVKKAQEYLGAAKVNRLIDSGGEVVIIDVRSRAEHEERRIAGSVNVPLDQLKSNINQFAPDKSVPVAVYCLSGGRAGSAVGILKNLGYKTVVNLGGINSWKRGFESGKPKKARKKKAEE